MRYVHILGFSAVMSAALIFAAARTDAQDRPVGGVPRNNFSSGGGFHGGGMHGGRFHGFGGGIWVVDREVEVPVYVEVPVQTPPPPAAANSGTPNRDVPELARKPYAIGASYDSLPGGCMKLIEAGVSYYYCSGEWYRQIGEGRGATYKAVARKL